MMNISTESISPHDKILNTLFANTRFETREEEEGLKKEDLRLIQHIDSHAPAAAAAAVPVSDTLSLAEFRDALKENLKSSDALSSIKAQIRKTFIKGLVQQGGSTGKSKKSQEIVLKDRMVMSAVHHFLKHRGLHGTVSVYMAESGLESNQTILTEVDIARLFKIQQLRSTFLKHVSQTIYPSSSGNEVTGGSGEIPSLLEVIFDFCLLLQADCYKETSCQTEVHGPTTREILDLELRGIRNTFTTKQQEQIVSPLRTVEEKMLTFQRECEERSRKAIDQQMTFFRENEIQRIRLEEQTKYQTELTNYRKALDADYQVRLQNHLEREASSARRLAEQEKAFQQRLYEQRQSLQIQIDSLTASEQAMHRRMELEKEGLKVLEYRLKESQLLQEARERSLTEKEKSLQAKSEDCLRQARQEVRKEWNDNLEANQQERLRLLAEGKKLEEDRLRYEESRLTMEQLRNQVKRLHEEVSSKDIEISALQQSQDFLKSQILAEDKHISQILETVDPSLCSLPRSKQILGLMEANRQLMEELDTLHDEATLLRTIAEKEKEVTLLKTSLKDSFQRWDEEKQQLRKELEDRRVLSDKLKEEVNTVSQQLQSMKSILMEKNQLIETLSRAPKSTILPMSASVSSWTNRLPPAPSQAVHHHPATSSSFNGLAPYTVHTMPTTSGRGTLQLPRHPTYLTNYEQKTTWSEPHPPQQQQQPPPPAPPGVLYTVYDRDSIPQSSYPPSKSHLVGHESYRTPPAAEVQSELSVSPAQSNLQQADTASIRELSNRTRAVEGQSSRLSSAKSSPQQSETSSTREQGRRKLPEEKEETRRFQESWMLVDDERMRILLGMASNGPSSSSPPLLSSQPSAPPKAVSVASSAILPPVSDDEEEVPHQTLVSQPPPTITTRALQQQQEEEEQERARMMLKQQREDEEEVLLRQAAERRRQEEEKEKEERRKTLEAQRLQEQLMQTQREEMEKSQRLREQQEREAKEEVAERQRQEQQQQLLVQEAAARKRREEEEQTTLRLKLEAEAKATAAAREAAAREAAAREAAERKRREEEEQQEAEAEAEAERKRREEEEAEKRKKQEDDDEIMAARARVLARRKMKADRDRADEERITASSVASSGDNEAVRTSTSAVASVSLDHTVPITRSLSFSTTSQQQQQQPAAATTTAALVFGTMDVRVVPSILYSLYRF
eukprot:scaffold8015_cov165-Ochromonas_danica.AAC.1